MQVVIGFLAVTFLAALWRPQRRAPGNVGLALMVAVVAVALLSHKVA